VGRDPRSLYDVSQWDGVFDLPNSAVVPAYRIAPDRQDCIGVFGSEPTGLFVQPVQVRAHGFSCRFSESSARDQRISAVHFNTSTGTRSNGIYPVDIGGTLLKSRASCCPSSPSYN
jgi:hypothetical protein